MLNLPSKDALLKAKKVVSEFAHQTPVLTSQSLNEITGLDIYFKCENFQKVGAFKFRGAVNAVSSLSDSDRGKGVVTHSSGNHAQALALASRLHNINATIVMPENAPRVKKEAVKGYGARVKECKPTQAAREQTVQRIMDETGAVLVHPYNDYSIVCGQATAAMELIDQVDELDYIITPVGGGGLLSGTSLAAHYFAPGIEVWGGEPENADDANRSLQEGKIMPSLNPDTIADGLLTSLGEKTFGIISKYSTGIITVSEEEIIAAMKLVLERMKILIEPSSAVPVAAIIKEPNRFKNGKTGVIISGGNVDLSSLPF